VEGNADTCEFRDFQGAARPAQAGVISSTNCGRHITERITGKPRYYGQPLSVLTGA
jgi:hypothetical protein